jgi:hypothetical protein
MPSKSPEPPPSDPVHTKRALVTVEAFLQASGCPNYTKNACVYLKNGLEKLGAPQSPSAILSKIKFFKNCLLLRNSFLPLPLHYQTRCHMQIKLA